MSVRIRNCPNCGCPIFDDEKMCPDCLTRVDEKPWKSSTFTDDSYIHDLEEYCDELYERSYALEKALDKACDVILRKDFALTKDSVYTKEQWKEYLLKDEN